MLYRESTINIKQGAMPEIPFKTVAGFVTVVIVIGCILLLSKPGFDMESVLYFNNYEPTELEDTLHDTMEATPESDDESFQFEGIVKADCPPPVVQDVTTMQKKDPALAHAVYRDLRPFFLAYPRGVTRVLPPIYLKDVKNPCFAMDQNYINIGNINLTTALNLNYEIKCMPGAYLAGKCWAKGYRWGLNANIKQSII